MISMLLRRDRTDRNKPGPFNRAVTDLRDAVDSATRPCSKAASRAEFFMLGE